MATVTIEGSRMLPNTYLRPGKRMTVERTPLVDKMLRNGFVTLVQGVDATQHVIQIVDDQREAADNERQLSGTPARNASRDEWAAFLRDEGVPFEDGDTRNELIAAWDSFFPDEVEPDGDADD